MPQITLESIEAHRADVLLPPDDEFAAKYDYAVSEGRRIARKKTAAFVAICRNAMPWLPRTLELVEQTGAMFRQWSAFIYENDSTDATRDVLSAWQDGSQRNASLNIHSRPHLSHTTSQERTVALAEYRSECQWWVRHGDPVDYVIVFDTDPWGGWSVNGVATSICYLEKDRYASTMASFSWCELQSSAGPVAAHYDAFAARLNHWRQRDQQWFHLWKPPVGSPPVQFHSAFGQLAVYKHNAYVAGSYTGDDCEHVTFHRSIPGRLYLNPSSRCVSFWMPHDGWEHRDD